MQYTVIKAQSPLIPLSDWTDFLSNYAKPKQTNEEILHKLRYEE